MMSVIFITKVAVVKLPLVAEWAWVNFDFDLKDIGPPISIH